MRNIALLEWGPASLFYINPREKIKVRMDWQEGGPIMPPFLSTLEEAKSQSSDIGVRYALSAFEDLNSAIRNLRRCFGFPYQEYIGYLNILTRTHRARREHEGLVDRLRRWAIYGNVDAVVWIDYAKANQPPGSFKVGSRDSRPFSKAHMELCTSVPSGTGFHDDDVDESEGGWTEIEEDVPGAFARTADTDYKEGTITLPRGTVALRGRSSRTYPMRKFQKSASSSEPPKAPAPVDATPKSPMQATSGAQDILHEQSLSPSRANTVARSDEQLKKLRSLIQEEVIPAHGSIYPRSIVPGPGHYYNPGVHVSREAGKSFGHRPKGYIDQAVVAAKAVPGPGEYKAKPPLCDLKARCGAFDHAEKLVEPIDKVRKLPYISPLASSLEAHHVHSPPLFHTVSDDAPCNTHGYQRPPRYSFGRARRPW